MKNNQTQQQPKQLPKANTHYIVDEPNRFQRPKQTYIIILFIIYFLPQHPHHTTVRVPGELSAGCLPYTSLANVLNLVLLL